MNRTWFIVSFTSFIVFARLLQIFEIQGYGFMIIGIGAILVSIRRHYLGLKPWWGAPLKDIPKYFKKP